MSLGHAASLAGKKVLHVQISDGRKSNVIGFPCQVPLPWLGDTGRNWIGECSRRAWREKCFIFKFRRAENQISQASCAKCHWHGGRPLGQAEAIQECMYESGALASLAGKCFIFKFRMPEHQICDAFHAKCHCHGWRTLGNADEIEECLHQPGNCGELAGKSVSYLSSRWPKIK